MPSTRITVGRRGGASADSRKKRIAASLGGKGEKEKWASGMAFREL